MYLRVESILITLFKKIQHIFLTYRLHLKKISKLVLNIPANNELSIVRREISH